MQEINDSGDQALLDFAGLETEGAAEAAPFAFWRTFAAATGSSAGNKGLSCWRRVLPRM